MERWFQTQGFEGLKDLPPIHKSRPQTTPLEVVEKIGDLALAHPAYGCDRHEAALALEGVRVSSIMIQKILNDSGHGARMDRRLALEQKKAEQMIDITAEQTTFLEKLNLCFCLNRPGFTGELNTQWMSPMTKQRFTPPIRLNFASALSIPAWAR